MKTPIKFYFIFTIIIILFSSKLHGQQIFSVKYDYQADIKVYVVSYSYQADLKVYKVSSSYQADEDGLWYFTDYDYQADKKVYITHIELVMH